jgi:hypothetical protein
MYGRFGTICPIFIGCVNRVVFFTRRMKMEQCFGMSAHKIQTPGNHPKERIQHSEHGESLKSSRCNLLAFYFRVFTAILYADTMYIRPIPMEKEGHLLYECRKITASVTTTLAPTRRTSNQTTAIRQSSKLTSSNGLVDSRLANLFWKLRIFYNKRVVKLRASSNGLF